jgi:hypothetical protein
MVSRRTLYTAAALVAAALLLMAEAFYNGYPLLFSDSADYLADGYALVRLKFPGFGRPIFYGMAIWPFHLERSPWPVIFVQGLIVAHCIHAVLRVLKIACGPVAFVALVLVLTVVSPISWHVAEIMPDFFAGLLAVILFLLAFGGSTLSRVELAYFAVLATAAISFHLSYIPLALALAFAIALAWLLFADARRRINPVLPFLSWGAAVLLMMTYSYVVDGQLSLAPRAAPWPLASLLVQGPGKQYLEESCGSRHLVLCDYLDRIPATPEDFLFKPDSPLRINGNFDRVRQEQWQIFVGTARTLPLTLAKDAIEITGEQLVTFDNEVWWAAANEKIMLDAYPKMAKGYEAGLEKSDRARLVRHAERENAWRAPVIYGTLPVALFFVVGFARRKLYLPVYLAGLVAVDLVANAFITGTLSAVHNRYEGRVIWLLPLLVLVMFYEWTDGSPVLWLRRSLIERVRSRHAEARAAAVAPGSNRESL